MSAALHFLFYFLLPGFDLCRNRGMRIFRKIPGTARTAEDAAAAAQRTIPVRAGEAAV